MIEDLRSAAADPAVDLGVADDEISDMMNESVLGVAGFGRLNQFNVA